MRRPRRVSPRPLIVLAAAGLSACAWMQPPSATGVPNPTAAAAAPQAAYCARPAEKTATDVVGLKTWLMVVALTCKERTGYNAFVTGQRAGLARHEAALNGYFRRNYGSKATVAHDDYITQLANLQSEQSLRQGTSFCPNNQSAMGEVRTVRGANALGAYATAHAPSQPERFEICQSSAAALP